MSYILEAIKRSERERLSASVSRLPVLPVFGEGVKPPPLLLYGAVSAVLVTAGIAIGWLRPWQPGKTAVPPVLAAVAPDSNVPVAMSASAGGQADPARLAATPAPEKVEVLHVMKVRPYRAPTHAPTDAPARAPKHARPRADRETPPAAQPPVAAVRAAAPVAPPVAPVTAPPAASPITLPVAAPATAAVAPAAAATSAPAAGTLSGNARAAKAGEGTAPAPTDVADSSIGSTPAAPEAAAVPLYDLPPEILREIPPMTISGFTYSDAPKGRMVGINDRLLQEGQYVADGLKLEQITPDGLIFSFRNYRFRRNLQ